MIVNKFVQPSAVTCLSWPFDDKILVGQLDGKVRMQEEVERNEELTV